MSIHMANAGSEVVAANGFGTRIMMIDKDARRMDVVRALREVIQFLVPSYPISSCFLILSNQFHQVPSASLLQLLVLLLDMLLSNAEAFGLQAGAQTGWHAARHGAQSRYPGVRGEHTPTL